MAFTHSRRLSPKPHALIHACRVSWECTEATTGYHRRSRVPPSPCPNWFGVRTGDEIMDPPESTLPGDPFGTWGAALGCWRRPLTHPTPQARAHALRFTLRLAPPFPPAPPEGEKNYPLIALVRPRPVVVAILARLKIEVRSGNARRTSSAAGMALTDVFVHS